MLREFHTIVQSMIRNIGGSTGRRLRYLYYRSKFKNCGVNVQIDEGVFFHGLKNISLGSNVWIDKFCVFIAGKTAQNTIENTKTGNLLNNVEEGDLVMGSNIHIGINTFIQAHGGVKIGNYFTSSPSCKIYSLSNDVVKSIAGTYGEGEKFYVKSPILIDDNVWLGINTAVFGGEIGKNSFIAPNSCVTGNIEENSYAAGSPAVKIKNRLHL